MPDIEKTNKDQVYLITDLNSISSVDLSSPTWGKLDRTSLEHVAKRVGIEMDELLKRLDNGERIQYA